LETDAKMTRHSPEGPPVKNKEKSGSRPKSGIKLQNQSSSGKRTVCRGKKDSTAGIKKIGL